MLACVLILTKYAGVYSLIIGMLGQYVITAVLNCTFLRKTLGGKLGTAKFLIMAILFIIPAIIYTFFNFESFNLLTKSE